jgi:hypothetical protein
MINLTEEKFLEIVYKIIKEQENRDVVAYNSDGSPISPNVLKEGVKSASIRVKSGDFITQEEVEKEVENW